jgi:hypothetical protein
LSRTFQNTIGSSDVNPKLNLLISQSSFIYSLRIVSCNSEVSLLKSRSLSSSEIAPIQLAALNKEVSVIAEFSLAVVASFDLLFSRLFKS